MKKRTKILAVTICAAAIAAVSAFGTLAYLTNKTEGVKNTFTVGKLLPENSEFVLLEHEAVETKTGSGVYNLNKEKEVSENSYAVLPGVDLPKDPFMSTRDKDSKEAVKLELDAYVYLEVIDGTKSPLTVTIDATHWTEMADIVGPNGGKVYSKGMVTAGTAIDGLPVLVDNEITVGNADIPEEPGTVSFYGYLIQAAGFESAADAWTSVYSPAND